MLERNLCESYLNCGYELFNYTNKERIKDYVQN